MKYRLVGVYVAAVACLGLAQPIMAQYEIAAEGRAKLNSRALEALFVRPVTIDVNRVSLKRAIDAVAQSAKVLAQYRLPAVEAYTEPVTVHLVNVPLRVALEQVLAGTTLQVIPDGAAQLIIAEGGRNRAGVRATGEIVGKVIDAKTKLPLRGATVRLDEATKGVISDDAGSFRIPSVREGSHTVTVRALGYVKTTSRVSVIEGQTAILEITVDPGVNTLDQVVVTGTVVQTELKAVPNAITVITAKQIEERGITKIDQLFHGDVPGLFAQNQGANALLDEVTMFSRGASAIPRLNDSNDGTNPIKTYIDGVEMADPKYLSQIDPKSIERIEILTGPQASTIYGSGAINGVMQIFTKRGTSNTPQLTLNLLSGVVQNNFSSALTPQHDYSAQLNGLEGKLAYNAGGSWNYVGPWTPAKQTTRTSAFGGIRLEIPMGQHPVTIDATMRLNDTQNHQRGVTIQTFTGYQESGWYSYLTTGLSAPTTLALTGQTFGLQVGTVFTNWWSQTFDMGQDAANTQTRRTARGYSAVSDTTLQLQQTHIDRRSLRYTTTAKVPVTAIAQATVTAGLDAWQTVVSSMSVSPQTLTGTLSGATSLSRQPGHNTGGFFQTQLGIRDRLFVTYGLRAEWNPNYGANAQPNYAPRYGVAYTQDLGVVTVKLRSSYGRSTRPPQPNLKVAQTAAAVGFGNADLADYGNFDYYLANPELGPEHQQGGEGGVELYWNTHGSLVITRYNQTIDGLIAAPTTDSVRSRIPNPPSGGDTPSDAGGYRYRYQHQYLNVASLRNQGWELHGTANTGPFTTTATYSWTRSRTIGVTPKYRAFFTPNAYRQYQPGATFYYLPEHTWALGITYALAKTTVALNVNGVGRTTNIRGDDFFFRALGNGIRLSQNRANVTFPPYVSFNQAYALADVTLSRRFSPRIEGLVQAQNLADHYTNDYYSIYPTIGRQMRLGARLRP